MPDVAEFKVAEFKVAVATMRAFVAELEPDCFSGSDALALLGDFTEAERVAVAGRTLMAKRVEESNVWRASGERSAAHFLANQTGTTVGRSQSALETAERLAELPATAEAFRAGKLSEIQVEAVAGAAAVNPNEEQRLLDRVGRSTAKQLRDECRRVKHAGTDEQARHEAIRRDRHLRTWVDAEGAFNGAFRTTVDSGAAILAALEVETERVFAVGRKEGRREPRQAYAMDALEALVCSGGGGKKPKQLKTILGILDYEALRRGFTIEGEACELAGLGPVPVSVIKSWVGDAHLRLLVTDGIDIRTVTRQTRYVDPNQRAALAVRDRSCIITRCDVDQRLQIDHVIPFAEGGPTCTLNNKRFCGFHHLLKTKGWILVGGPSDYRLVPPGTDTGDRGEQGRAPPPG